VVIGKANSKADCAFSRLMLLFRRCVDYLNDPYSNGNPGHTICSRDDLYEETPMASGCFDAKVRSFGLSACMSLVCLSVCLSVFDFVSVMSLDS